MTSILSFANRILNNESSWINTMAIIQTEDGSYLRENSEDSPIIGPFSDLEWHNIDEFAFDIQRSLSSSSSSSEQNVCSQVFDVYGSTSHSITQTEMPRDSMTPTDLPAGPALPARRARDRRAPSQAIKSPQMLAKRRREQNRVAQRAYRQRKEEHIKELETQLQSACRERDAISRLYTEQGILLVQMQACVEDLMRQTH